MNTAIVRNGTESNKPEISKSVAKLYRGGYVAGAALGWISGAYASGHVSLEDSAVFLAVAMAGLAITTVGKKEHLNELKSSKRE